MDTTAHVDAMLTQVQESLETPIEDEQELERLRRGVQGVAERAATLSAYRLANADEPDFVFRAYRSESE